MAAITPNWADKPHNMAAIYKLAYINEVHTQNIRINDSFNFLWRII